MRNSPILRYIAIGLLHGLMYALGILLFPIWFSLRRLIIKHKTPILWWFLNDDEGDYVSNIYGDAGYRAIKGFDYETANWLQKTWQGFNWGALRNSHWNFRIHVLKPKQGTPYDVDVIINNTFPLTNGMTFCNFSIFGEQFAKYTVDGVRYFRYSFTKPTPKFLQWLGFMDTCNLHTGWATGRWLIKCRWFNK